MKEKTKEVTTVLEIAEAALGFAKESIKAVSSQEKKLNEENRVNAFCEQMKVINS